MPDHENAAPTEEVRSDETPSIPPPPLRFSKRDLRIGGGGIGLGLVVGVLRTLLIASVASGAGSARGELGASATPSAVKTSPMTDAAKACNVLSNDWITVGDAGQSISMKSNGKKSLGADIDDLACVLGELHTRAASSAGSTALAPSTAGRPQPGRTFPHRGAITPIAASTS
jgi:hypothetical protein